MATLASLASLIRSKNAGPFHLTFDIMFKDPDAYQRVKRARVLSATLFADLYRTRAEDVMFLECDRVYAFKVSIPRVPVQGSIGETDSFGGQQFDPISGLDIPDD